MQQASFLAVDIGGTKIEVAVFDEAYTLLKNERFPTADFKKGSLGFLNGVYALLEREQATAMKGLGVSMNCVVKDGSVTYSSLLGGVVSYPLAQTIQERFGVFCALENDVHCMALAESTFGQGQNVESFVLINLGTGIRLSHVVQGRLIRGWTNNAGEICLRRMRVPEFPGREFAIDVFLSGTGVRKIYEALTGSVKTSQEVFDNLATDAHARTAVDIFARYFGEFLAEVCFFYNPQRIIINGSLKKRAQDFLPLAQDILAGYALDFFHPDQIVLSRLDHGAVLGAAWLAAHPLGEKA